MGTDITTANATKELAAANNFSTTDLLSWAFSRFHPRLALACSFQAEGSVLIDLIHQLRGADFRVFTLDTGRLNQETYDCMEAIRTRYGIEIEVFFPDSTQVEEMVRQHGMNLFYDSIERWMTGLRREQAVTRTQVQKVEIDHDHGNIVKINPLADWTERQIWDYVRGNNLPYNRLHDQGYPSIGCAPCTRAVQAGEDSRAGRWWWENPETKECGLHLRRA